MKVNRTLTLYLTLVAVVTTQVIYQWNFAQVFTIGLVPLFVFGTVWNMINGLRLYEMVDKRDQFNKPKFIIVNAIGLVYWIISTILWNMYRNPPTPVAHASLGDILFPFIYGLVTIVSIYLPIYSISFVTRAMTTLNASKNRLALTMAIIFFPIGLGWIEGQIAQERST